ncbi:MAG TPA: SIS domain-containing protein [Acidimicrobiales bacterium]|nr:SIS domain-containing protein [Acidimicrobiales bacterium]
MSHPYPVDTLGLWDATAGLPEQLGAAADGAIDVLRRVTLPARLDLRSVVVCGVGSSGLAGDAAAAMGASIPIVVSRGDDVPAFVGPDSLVFAVSWSGDTDETVTAARAARERGAPMIVISGGGALTELALASDLAHFPLPADLPASRAAWGAAVVPLLLTLEHLGVVPDVTKSLADCLPALRRRRDALVAARSPAEEVARRIGRTMPLIYGSVGTSAVAAQRWKTQINANAKTPAFAAVQPELSHNEVAGWGQHGDVTRQVLSLVTLRHAAEGPLVARRVAFVNQVIDEVMADVIPVWTEGEDDLARLFDLSLFGDFVSLHLAGREGTDPGPVPAVEDGRASETQENPREAAAKE